MILLLLYIYLSVLIKNRNKNLFHVDIFCNALIFRHLRRLFVLLSDGLYKICSRYFCAILHENDWNFGMQFCLDRLYCVWTFLPGHSSTYCLLEGYDCFLDHLCQRTMWAYVIAWHCLWKETQIRCNSLLSYEEV